MQLNVYIDYILKRAEENVLEKRLYKQMLLNSPKLLCYTNYYEHFFC